MAKTNLVNTGDEALGLLKAACARSAVVEFHRQEGTLAIPAARARMLAIDGNGIVLDRPQVIGREVPLGAGQTVDAFITIDDELYTFQTSVINGDVPVTVNGEKHVKGVRIQLPGAVRVGQRRQYFRTSLALVQPLPVTLHRTDREDPTATPVGAHHFKGQLLDASAGGFGVRVDDVIYTRFKIYNHYFLTFITPDQEEETTVLCELRQTRPIRDGESVKIGLLTLPWPSQRELDRKLQPLVRYLTEMQRRTRRAG